MIHSIFLHHLILQGSLRSDSCYPITAQSFSLVNTGIVGQTELGMDQKCHLQPCSQTDSKPQAPAHIYLALLQNSTACPACPLQHRRENSQGSSWLISVLSSFFTTTAVTVQFCHFGLMSYRWHCYHFQEEPLLDMLLNSAEDGPGPSLLPCLTSQRGSGEIQARGTVGDMCSEKSAWYHLHIHQYLSQHKLNVLQNKFEVISNVNRSHVCISEGPNELTNS